MKYVNLLIICLFISGCISPSTAMIQTAIAETQEVSSISMGIVEVTKVILPTEIIDSNEIQAEVSSVDEFSSSFPMECSEAPLGENVTCIIQKAYCSYKPSIKGNPTFCNDAPYPNHNFTLLVWGQDWTKFDGECLNVTGYIHLYKGNPQIEATSESQVRICN
jgi:hypothetical protein